jgi:hypothetical protein
MNVYRREDPASVVSLMRLAAESGFYTGRLHTPAARFYFDLCTSLGEVYSRELTEAGWKSFSEIHGEGVAEFSMGDPS